MNRKFKTFGAAVLAAAMCASFAGCANNEQPNGGNSKDTELNESNIESHIESIFGIKDSSSPQPESSEPEEIKIKMTDEIKNAALGSGYTQINNDIFQRGGYITAADFVEKWKDSYDIEYACPQGAMISTAGTYDECKDYLIDYYNVFENSVHNHWRWIERENFKARYHYLYLTPKNGGVPVFAFVVNATSPDEKITVDKAIVAEVQSPLRSIAVGSDPTPEWFPLGLMPYNYEDTYESENLKYTVKTLGEALEAKGITKNSDFEPGMLSPSSSKKENHNTYWYKKKADYICCYALGEKNLFDATPLYEYTFTIDPNTDKIKYATCSLEYFIKE